MNEHRGKLNCAFQYCANKYIQLVNAKLGECLVKCNICTGSPDWAGGKEARARIKAKAELNKTLLSQTDEHGRKWKKFCITWRGLMADPILSRMLH